MRRLVSSWLSDLPRDLVYAFRMFVRNPGFALTAVLSLAIGIGANTTIFTIANALLLRPPTGVIAPDQLVDIGFARSTMGGFNPGSFLNYQDLRRRTTTLSGVYGSTMFADPVNLGTATKTDAVDQAFAGMVTLNFFSVLGARPAAGRLFDANDIEQPGASPIVVLSHGFWTRRFKNDPSLIGQPLEMNGHKFTVVGVAAEGFSGTSIRTADLWIPANMAGSGPTGSTAALTNRGAGWLMLGGRLKAGATVEQATAELESIGRALQTDFPDENRGLEIRVLPMSPVTGSTETFALFLGLLMAMVVTVLAIACANLAGVLLARAVARRREIAVRLAIGASRGRLIRLLLTETFLLFFIGGVGGLVMARFMTSLLLAVMPALPFPLDVTLPLDRRVIAFTIGLSFLAALMCGLVPAFQGSKSDVVSALKDDSQGAGAGRSRFRHGFVIAQVSFSILLVVIAGLFVRALQRAGAMDPGFDPNGVDLASIDLTVGGYNETTGPLFARELLNRVKTMTTVQDASMAAVLPGGFEGIGLGGLVVPDMNLPPGQDILRVTWNTIEPAYFKTIKMALLSGRDFTNDDTSTGTPVAIIGENAAKKFFPGQNAIGKFVLRREWGPAPGGGPKPSTRLTVVGVVRDPKYGSLVDATTGFQIYVPIQQQYVPQLMIVARSVHGHSIANELRALVASANPKLPVNRTQTAEEYTRLALLPQRIAVSVSGSLGLVGLLLAAMGIYGVTAYMVARRTREIGIRIALGAGRADIIRMVLRQGLILATIGSAIGLVLAAGVSQLLTGYLFGLPPLDPPTFIGAAVLFAIVGLVACYAPARRATRLSPLTAFRQE